MIWLSWRQARASVLVAAAGAAALVVLAALTGPHLADLARRSGSVFDALTATDMTMFYAGIALVAAAPALVGAFWGAPLIAREIETGTHRLVWTQSVTRTRWLTARSTLTGLAAAGVVGAVSLTVTRWAAPLDGAASATRGALPGRLTPVSFAMRGVAPIGYAVFAVALGVLIGAVLRHTLAAMAITLVLYVAVQIAVPTLVRPHLITPVTATIPFSTATLDGINLDAQDHLSITVHTADRHDWILGNDTIDPHGAVAPLPSWFPDCLPPVDGPRATSGTSVGGTSVHSRADSPDACLTRLTDDGYRQRVSYQPADRFWPLQWAETGMYLAASALLLSATFWWTRRRIA